MISLAAFGLDNATVAKVGSALTLLALPWVSSWKKIDWHFKHGKKSLALIFNGTASVLASLLFTGAVYKTPPEWWVRLSIWIGFASVGILVVVYVGILLAFKRTVSEGRALLAVLFALACYIALWGVAAVYTRQVFIFHDYRVNGGFVYLDGKPAQLMRLELVAPDGERIGQTETNPNGSWLDFRDRNTEDGAGLSPRSTRLRLLIPGQGSAELPLVAEGRVDHIYRFQTPPP
jgi:hypothetical protein